MKVKFYLDSGANIHSCRSEILDTVKDLGLDEGEWETLTDDLKMDMVKEWGDEHLSMYYEELS